MVWVRFETAEVGKVSVMVFAFRFEDSAVVAEK